MENMSLKKSDALRREKETRRGGPGGGCERGHRQEGSRCRPIGPAVFRGDRDAFLHRERTGGGVLRGGAQDFLLFYSFKEWQP